MKTLVTIITLFTATLVFAQTTNNDGAYTTGSNWSGGSYPGSYAGSTLTLTNQTINIENDITIGDVASRIDVYANNSNFSGAFNVNDTLIVYGNIEFANKAMSLNIGENGMLIVLGSVTLNNKTTVASSGVLAVAGDIIMTGSEGQKDYNGTGGTVYAGGYPGYSADVIDGGSDVDNPSRSIDELSDYGMQDIEDFINGGGSGTLPILLGYFDLSSENNEVAIEWSTLTEENFDYFEIQRANTDGTFEIIGTVEGNGWSSEEIEYSFIDNQPTDGKNIYRLESVDFDGYRETFPAKVINVQKENENISFYPSVATSNATINVSTWDNVAIKIIDQRGSVAYETTVEGGSFELPNLENGTYIIQYSTQGGTTQATRMIVK